MLDAESPEEITTAMDGFLETEASFIMQGTHYNGLDGLLDYHASIKRRFGNVTANVSSIHLVKSTRGVHELSAEFTMSALYKMTGMKVNMTGKQHILIRHSDVSV